MATLKSAEDVADEIAARLATCTVALGAETDLGARVYRGRKTIDDSQIPCSVIIEGDDVPQDQRQAQVALAQRYVLFAYLACDPDNPNTAAHKGLRDLKRAIFRTDGKWHPTWGGKVKNIEYLGRDIGPRADGSGFVVAVIEIGVEYVEDLAAP